ncbi:MAG: OmpA family protein [Planktomarina sp.]
MRLIGFALLLMAPQVAGAQSLQVPGSPVSIATEAREGLTFDLPVGIWDGAVPTTVLEGRTQHQVFHLPRNAGAVRVIEQVLAQLLDQGYETLLSCRDKECGGFDFRFALDLIKPPKLFIDLGHYQYVSAQHPDGRGIALLASRTQDNVHLHITTITPEEADGVTIEGVAYTPVDQPHIDPTDLPTALDTTGSFILSDLRFKTGSSQLDGDSFASLTALSDYLSAAPQRTIALVGHTDATGALDGNIALSRKRADAVRTLLLGRYGIAPDRVAAEGMGYLAPVAVNTTDVGRALNRRVEVIVTSTK